MPGQKKKDPSVIATGGSWGLRYELLHKQRFGGSVSLKLQTISVHDRIGNIPSSMHAILARPDFTTTNLVIQGNLDELKNKTFVELEKIALAQHGAQNGC